jgi:hypothetical protein
VKKIACTITSSKFTPKKRITISPGSFQVWKDGSVTIGPSLHDLLLKTSTVYASTFDDHQSKQQLVHEQSVEEYKTIGQ